MTSSQMETPFKYDSAHTSITHSLSWPDKY